MNAIIKLITALIEPFTRIIDWFMGRSKRKADVILELQGQMEKANKLISNLYGQIMELSKKNAEMYEELIAVRKENAELIAKIDTMQARLDDYGKKNEVCE